MGRLNVAMVSRMDDASPVAGYVQALTGTLREYCEVLTAAIPAGKQTPESYEELAVELNKAEVIHLQHFHRDWGGARPGESGFWTWRYLLVKPLVVTAHDTRSLNDLLRKQRTDEGSGLGRIMSDAILARRSAHRDSVEIAPFVTGRCIVLTEQDRETLVDRGADPQFVHLIPPAESPEGWAEAARITAAVYSEAMLDKGRLGHHGGG